MFCPSCGRDNANELKFCASCGTNLEAVSRALADYQENVATRLDASLDHFISRYTEHIFREKATSGESTVLRSWTLLGQAFLTSLIDLLMFIIMWNILPARFFLLLITSPIRLLSEKSRERAEAAEEYSRYEPPELTEPKRGFLERGVPSVTEETTTNLTSKRTKEKVPITDKLK